MMIKIPFESFIVKKKEIYFKKLFKNIFNSSSTKYNSSTNVVISFLNYLSPNL